MHRTAPHARVILGGIALAIAAVVVAALALILWPQGRDIFTDADTISQPASVAPIRDILWQPPVPLATPVNSPDEDYEPRLTADGLTLFFVRGKAGHNADIYVSTRTTAGWSEPQPLSDVNSDGDDLGPQPTSDGASLYFYSNRPGGQGGYDLWVSYREGDRWTAAINLGPDVNSPYNEYSPALAPDDSALIFASNRPRPGESPETVPPTWPATVRESGHAHDYDLYEVSLSPDHSAKTEALLALNTPANEGTPAFSPAGDFLYFSSDRSGGLGGFDLYRSRRLRGVFEPPTNLKDPINTPFNDLDPALTQTGFALTFSSDRPASFAMGSDGRGDYNLYSSTSREVFRKSREADLAGLWATLWPKLLWLLLSILALLLLYFLYRDARRRHLSILAKCLLASLAIHALLMLALNLWGVTNSLGELFKRPGGSRVILTDAPSGTSEGLATQIRGQITDSSYTLPNAPSTSQDISVPLAEPVAIPQIAPPVTQIVASAHIEVATREAQLPSTQPPIALAAPATPEPLPLATPAQAQPMAAAEPKAQAAIEPMTQPREQPRPITRPPAPTSTTSAAPAAVFHQETLANAPAIDSIAPSSISAPSSPAADSGPSIAARIPQSATPVTSVERAGEVSPNSPDPTVAPLATSGARASVSTSTASATQPIATPLLSSSPQDSSPRSTFALAPMPSAPLDVTDIPRVSVALPASPAPSSAAAAAEPTGSSLAISDHAAAAPALSQSSTSLGSLVPTTSAPASHVGSGSSLAVSSSRDSPVTVNPVAVPGAALRGLSESPHAAASVTLPSNIAPASATSEPSASISAGTSLADASSLTPVFQAVPNSSSASAAGSSVSTPAVRPQSGTSLAATSLREAPSPATAASRPSVMNAPPPAADARAIAIHTPDVVPTTSARDHPSEEPRNSIAATPSAVTTGPPVAMQLSAAPSPPLTAPAPVTIAPAPILVPSQHADAPTAAASRILPPPDATFFGVAATGKRFAYVCDISGSMDKFVGDRSTRRIDVLKSELAASLNALSDNAQYFVCLFSDDAAILDDQVEWIDATGEGKAWARDRMKQVEADGDTRPLHAFQVVLSLDPKPDAIYFMTDGEFERAYVREIARLNEQYHIPIHCITFVSNKGERLMQRIAEDSGGTYTHVPGPVSVQPGSR